MVGHGERRVRDEVRRREAERAPALVAVGHDAARLERGAQEPRRLGHLPAATSPRMWVEETISPSSSTISVTRVSNAVCSRNSAVSPRARLPKRKFSPTDTQVAPQPLDQLVVDELLRGLRHPLAVERDHDQLVDPEAGDQVGLLLERREQLGRGLRRHDRARVRLERQDAVGAGDHGAVADVHAVELAHREPAFPRRRVRQPDRLHRRGSLRWASGSRLRAARRARSGRPRRAAGRSPWRGRAPRRRGTPARPLRARARPRA